MFLKSIEIQGFKSFVSRTVFQFKPGITGIVGPNGSGKSNIADAVRWVLGEQRTSQLRSGSMQDVIFAGTVSRKPLSYASVALTIDNSDGELPTDFSEVTVARKLYRSGESEYLINGQQCRLRDIQELFYDTGVGREGYSLIGQGQIDRIISGNPVTRRELFDEAAGIVKYKKRKEAAVKKLEEEQANLVRVDDILAELSSQVGPLKRQSSKAVRYLKYRDELKACEVNRFVLELERADQQIRQDRENLELAHDQMKQTDEEYEKTRELYGEVEEQLTLLDEQAAEARSKLTATDKLKTELEGQISVLKEQINSALTSRHHLQQRRMDLEGSMREAEEKLRDLTERYEKGSRELTDLQDENDLLVTRLEQSKVKKEALKEEQEKIRGEHLDLVRIKGEKNADREKNETLLSQLKLRNAESRTSIKELTEQIDSLTAQEKTLGSEKAALEKKWNAAGDQAEELKKKEEELSAKKAEADKGAQDANAEYQRLTARLTELRSLTERYEGFGESIRRVMELKDTSVCGVVADLIRTPKEYTEAVETALGRSLRYIVTEDEETARDMIGYLKKNRYGRATFLPLTAVNASGQARKDVLGEKGVIGTADTLVTCDERYRELITYLLGRIYVVEDLDQAVRIAKKYRHSLRMVTLEGDQLSPGGTMSGGAYRSSRHLLDRRAELDRLTGAEQKAAKALEKFRTEAEGAARELEKVSAKKEDAASKLQKVFVAVRENEVRLKNVTSQLNQLKSSLKEQQESLSGKEDQARKIQEQMIRVADGASSMEDREKALTIELNRIDKEVEAASDNTRTIAIEGENAHARLAACMQSQESLKLQIMSIRKDQEQRHRQMDEFADESPDTAAIIAEKEEKIADLQRTINSSAELFDEIRDQINACEKEKAELTESHREAIEEREALARQHAELEKEMIRLENRIETVTASREQHTAYMWEEYEITPVQAGNMRDPELTDLDELRNRTNDLKKSIRDLGNVNVNAIEQYKEVGERYELMSAQREDIMKAEETVLGVIDELDETMRAQFDAAFADINDQFNTVFGVLFGGGRGRLELVDDDTLSAGIRVIAQPPGKKLQNMMQLSGGEKSLTAIALLFAIQNLHPSPFCLLDEIEASLDDNNVTRFAEYLKRLTDRTQFIVITHRHGTMNAADRLYGITMQEKGVSTMVSVDLAKEQIDEQEREKENN